jgi:hypothetical protein
MISPFQRRSAVTMTRGFYSGLMGSTIFTQFNDHACDQIWFMKLDCSGHTKYVSLAIEFILDFTSRMLQESIYNNVGPALDRLRRDAHDSTGIAMIFVPTQIFATHVGDLLCQVNWNCHDLRVHPDICDPRWRFTMSGLRA